MTLREIILDESLPKTVRQVALNESFAKYREGLLHVRNDVRFDAASGRATYISFEEYGMLRGVATHCGKIATIKLFRQITGWELLDAKTACEASYLSQMWDSPTHVLKM